MAVSRNQARELAPKRTKEPCTSLWSPEVLMNRTLGVIKSCGVSRPSIPLNISATKKLGFRTQVSTAGSLFQLSTATALTTVRSKLMILQLCLKGCGTSVLQPNSANWEWLATSFNARLLTTWQIDHLCVTPDGQTLKENSLCAHAILSSAPFPETYA